MIASSWSRKGNWTRACPGLVGMLATLGDGVQHPLPPFRIGPPRVALAVVDAEGAVVAVVVAVEVVVDTASAAGVPTATPTAVKCGENVPRALSLPRTGTVIDLGLSIVVILLVFCKS